jgi:hypothetical protein
VQRLDVCLKFCCTVSFANTKVPTLQADSVAAGGFEHHPGDEIDVGDALEFGGDFVVAEDGANGSFHGHHGVLETCDNKTIIWGRLGFRRLPMQLRGPPLKGRYE